MFLGLSYISSIAMKVYANTTILSSWKSHQWTIRPNWRLSLWILLVGLICSVYNLDSIHILLINSTNSGSIPTDLRKFQTLVSIRNYSTSCGWWKKGRKNLCTYPIELLWSQISCSARTDIMTGKKVIIIRCLFWFFSS